MGSRESTRAHHCKWVDCHRAQPQHHDSDAALWKFSSSSSSLGSSPYMSANLRNRGPKLDRSSKFRSFSSVPASGDKYQIEIDIKNYSHFSILLLDIQFVLSYRITKSSDLDDALFEGWFVNNRKSILVVHQSEHIEIISCHVSLSTPFILVVDDVFPDVICVLEHVISLASMHDDCKEEDCKQTLNGAIHIQKLVRSLRCCQGQTRAHLAVVHLQFYALFAPDDVNMMRFVVREFDLFIFHKHSTSPIIHQETRET
uniref:Uncharacterized protein n=1 Tax=Timema bartmani TaxID=61472 RepID=A0A7R9I4L9_9NEOP|nr:unnamed protein product [Timema bartmani]